MKILVAISLILLSSLFILETSETTWAEEPNGARRVRTRQHLQKERISQGVESGELNRGEARKLRRQQRRIRRAKRRALKDDGTIDADEAKRLERKQDRANRNIYRKKHNKRKRDSQPEDTPQAESDSSE